MQEAGKSSDAVLVTTCGDSAWVRVVGRGSFAFGAAVKQFGVSAIGKGCRRMVVDMDACTGLDSTFMGVLAGLALRLRKAAGGSVLLINVSPRIAELLRTLGLDRVIEMVGTDAMAQNLRTDLLRTAGLERLDRGGATPRMTLQAMVDAHRDLIEVSAENEPRFEDVLTYLKDSLNRTAGENGAG